MAAGPIRGGFRLSASNGGANGQGQNQAESRRNSWKSPSSAGVFKPNPYARPFTPRSAGRLGEGLVDTLTGAVKRVFSFIYTDIATEPPVFKPEILQPRERTESITVVPTLPTEQQQPMATVTAPQLPIALKPPFKSEDYQAMETKPSANATEILSDLILNPKYKQSKVATFQQIGNFFEAKANSKLTQYEFDQIAAILRRLTSGPIVVQQHFKYPVSSGMASTVVLNDSPLKTIYVNNAVESDVVYSLNPSSETQPVLPPSRVFTARFDEDVDDSGNDVDSLMSTENGKVFVPIPAEVKLNLKQFSSKSKEPTKERPGAITNISVSQSTQSESKTESKSFAPIDSFKFSAPSVKPITESELTVPAPKELKFDFGAASIATVTEKVKEKETTVPSFSIPDFSTPNANKVGEFKPFEIPSFDKKLDEKPTTFSFGAPKQAESSIEKPKETAAPQFGTDKQAVSSDEKQKPGFTFGGPLKTTASTPFTFGVPKTSEETKPAASIFEAPKQSDDNKPAFSFAAPKASDEKPAPFSFSVPSSSAPSTASSGFTFGLPKAPAVSDASKSEVQETKPEPPKTNDIFKTASEAPKPFTFGSTDSATKPFTFGSSGTDLAKPYSFGVTTEKPALFGTTTEQSTLPAVEPIKASAEKAEEPKSFTFGASASEQSKPFTFGASSESKLFTFGQSSVPTVESAQKEEPKSAFTFGAKQEEPKVFTFGAKPEEPKPFTFGAKPEEPKTFSFGSKPEEPKPFTFGAKPEEPKPFTFGAKPEEPKSFTFGAKPEETKVFTFGAPTAEAKQSEDTSVKTGFSFSQPSTADSKLFTFGAPLAPVTEEKKPFTFGTETKAPSTFTFGSTESKKTDATSFVFGAPQPAAEKAATGFTFGQSSTSTTPAFTFGSQEPVKSTVPAPVSTGFTFGSQPQASSTNSAFSVPQPSSGAFQFGSQSNSGFSFSQTETEQPSAKRMATAMSNDSTSPFSFSAPPATATPSFSFPAPQSTQTSQPAFNFGAASQPPTTFTFGAPQSQPTQPFVFGSDPSGQSMNFNMGSSSPALGGRPKTTPVSRRRPHK